MNLSGRQREMNWKRIYLLVFAMLILCSGGIVYGQDTTGATAVIKVRKADSKVISKLRKDKDYNYDKTKPSRFQTLGEKVKQWLWDLLLSFFSDHGAAPYIRIGLLVLIALFIIFKLLNTDITRLFYKNKGITDIVVNELQEDINTLDFDSLIEKYSGIKDYRMAVRYYYLKLLKSLNDKELISWRINKTNRDYLHELQSSPHYGAFGKLSFFYEYIWYGDFVVTTEQFDIISRQFTDLLKSLSHEEEN